MSRLSRRRILQLGVIGGVATGGAGAAAWLSRDMLIKPRVDELVQLLRSEFEYLTFNFGDKQFVEYIQSYKEHYRDIWRETWYVFRGGDRDRHRHQMDHFAMSFLMSTDFFVTGADEFKPINYVMFYHPYQSPCWNPFSVG